MVKRDSIIEPAYESAKRISDKHLMKTYAYLVQDKRLKATVDLGDDDEGRDIKLGTTTYELNGNHETFGTSTKLINEIIESVATKITAELMYEELVKGNWNGVQKEHVKVTENVEVGNETKEVTGTEVQYKVNKDFIEQNYDL